MSMVRYECTAEGFEQNWAEISDRWTRRQILALEDTDEVAIPILQAKIGDCYLETETGAITNGKDLSADALYDMVAEVWGFVLQLPYKVWAKRSVVGKMSGRPSSLQNGSAPTTTAATVTD